MKMYRVFEEIGKALFNFANLVTAIIFLKAFFDKDEVSMLLYGIYFFVSFYFLGSVLLYLSKDKV